jgi:cyanate permease
MVTWGVISGMTAFIPQIAQLTGLSQEYTFYLLRVLLGLAEAGFFPGVIFYLTLWFPSAYRARIVGQFMAAIPVSSAVGAPISGQILGLNGLAGLAGWQWLFIIEALPALILSVVTYFYLTDRPAEATWLAPTQRTWLDARLQAEQAQREAAHQFSVLAAIVHPRVWGLALVYFGAIAGLYGVGFWLPQIVRGFGLSNAMTGWVVAIPYVAAAVAMVWYGRLSDRTQNRQGHVAVALLVAAAGIGASTLTHDPYLTMLALTVGSCGVFAVLPVFWTLPTAVLSGTSAAAGIAVINSVGNLSGFAGPYAMGFVKDATGSFSGGLMMIAAMAIVSAAIVLALGHDRELERVPGK